MARPEDLDSEDASPTASRDVPGQQDGAPADFADLASAIAWATARLEAAGVPSPRVDAELLAAHLRGVGPGRLRAEAVLGAGAPAGYVDLVERRAERIPLQHLTGLAPFRGLELHVGPGVFVPRPETEQVAEQAVTAARAALASRGQVTVADLCTGSGAVAAAVAAEVPGAAVHAVELDPMACAWAQRNLAGTGVHLHRGDAATALAEWDGRLDVVVSNPPYIPPGAVPRDVEVRDHDPAPALYGGGTDGLAVPRDVVRAARRLLRPGGALVMEHAEDQGAAVRALVRAVGGFTDVRTATDLAGRDRMVLARRNVEGSAP